MPGRILVLDDEPQITRVLRAALTAQAFDVRIANDPEEGLLLFRDWHPDLVVTDLMMPGMSGVEVCRAIRANSGVPILVLSVRDQERSKVEALDAGADGLAVISAVVGQDDVTQAAKNLKAIIEDAKRQKVYEG